MLESNKIYNMECIKGNENDVILDPSMGSGTTAVACIETNRKFIGFETSNTYYELANTRIKQIKTKS